MFNVHLYPLARLEARRALRTRWLSIREIGDLMEACDDDLIDTAAIQVGAAPPVGVLGDGTIVKMLIEFLKSEQGQALIKALVALLIGLV